VCISHVIDDVISHDDDDVINYVRPADTGKSIVTTDIRRVGWAGDRCDRRAVAAPGRLVDATFFPTVSQSTKSTSRRSKTRQ